MATTIRLTRMGRKQAPFYRLVVCDSRTRRDGAYIESLGHYNPMPDAFELRVDHERAVEWLAKGAQPTDTARSLLRNEGVLYRWHLMKTGAENIDAQVEDFRTRRVKAAEAIKAKTKAKLEAWHSEKEKAAKAKADAAKAEEEAAKVAAVAEAAAASAEETPAEESADAEASAEKKTEE